MRLYLEPGKVSRAVDADGNRWYRQGRRWRPAHFAGGTGEHGHAELQALAELVHGLAEPVEIRVPHELAEHQLKLIEALGGRVVIDPNACAGCGRRKSACRCPRPEVRLESRHP